MRSRERNPCRRLLVVGLLLCAPIRLLVADEPPRPLTVATWNLEWFFDDYAGDNYAELAKKQSAPSKPAWQWKRNAVAEAISTLKPTILALQEVENQQVLYYLVTQLRTAHHLTYHDAFIQGRDFYTEQDVGILYQSGLVRFCARRATAEMWASKKYYSVQKQLFASFTWTVQDGQEPLLVVTAHFRAMPKAAALRIRQARLLHDWVADALRAKQNVIVLGDFNTDVPFGETTPTCDIGVLRGLDTPDTNDDLVDLHQFLAPNQRGTHLMAGKQFDRILVSPALLEDTPGKIDLVFQSIARRKDVVVRGRQQDKNHWDSFYEIPEPERDISDHYPLIATFDFR